MSSGKYNRKDFHHQEAKKQGYRSRAYFKLEEIDQKYQLIRPGMSVVDLGAWPGGWLQYAVQKVGSKGKVLGIDLVEIDPLPQENVTLLKGDLSTEETIDHVLAVNGEKFDLLLSDMSPKFTGIKVSDQAKAASVGELAIYCAEKLLKNGGNLVIKVFKSPDTDQILQDYRKKFNKFIRCSLKSTRKTSNEFYLIGFGYRAE